MSAAGSAILIEPPVYFQTPPLVEPAATEAIRELVHELRQPLSAIEAIAYYVEMTLPPDQLHARQHMRQLQELVGRAEAILAASVSSARKPPACATGAS